MYKSCSHLMALILLIGCQPKLESNEQPMQNVWHSDKADVLVSSSLKAEEVFRIKLALGTNATNVQGKLVSETMDMGVVPLAFTSNDGRAFNAQSIVGACNLDTMIWRLELKWLEDGNQRFIVMPLEVSR